MTATGSGPITSHQDRRLLARADEAFRRIDATFSARQRPWLEEVPPTAFVEALDAYPPSARLVYVSPRVQRLREQVQEFGDASWVDRYIRLLLLLLLVRRLARPAPYRVPRSIDELLTADLVRIVDEASDPHEPRAFDAATSFDVGLCRGTVLPLGVLFAQLPFAVDPRLLERAGLEHVPSVPWLNVHLRTTRTVAYDREGRTAAYMRAGEFLAANSAYQGLLGISWLADPAVAQISPHLSHVLEQNREAGAHLVPLDAGDEATIANATKTSRTRRRLYEQGTYIPRDYAKILLREDLVRWARARTDPSLRFGA